MTLEHSSGSPLKPQLESDAADRSDRGPTHQRRWDRAAPWLLSAMSVCTLILLGLFLLWNVSWFLDHSMLRDDSPDSYRTYVLHMQMSLTKRTFGMFAGMATLFVGTAICFYTVRRQTTVGAEAKGISARIATASPGIIAMVLGVGLIAFVIASKDEFPLYSGPSRLGSVTMTPPPD